MMMGLVLRLRYRYLGKHVWLLNRIEKLMQGKGEFSMEYFQDSPVPRGMYKKS